MCLKKEVQVQEKNNEGHLGRALSLPSPGMEEGWGSKAFLSLDKPSQTFLLGLPGFGLMLNTSEVLAHFFLAGTPGGKLVSRWGRLGVEGVAAEVSHGCGHRSSKARARYS